MSVESPPSFGDRPGERSERSSDRRREIVRAAVRIADAEGVEAVSMRRLAEELGIATMSTYTHVESKDELIDLMRDEVSREMLVPEPLPGEWRPALTAIARRTKDAFEAHPWIHGAHARRPRGRINHMRHIEQSIQVVMMLGLPTDRGRAVLMAVDDYVIGYCLRAQARRRMVVAADRAEGPSDRDAEPGGAAEARVAAGRTGMRSLEEVDPELAVALEAGELPMVKRLFGRRDRRHPIGAPPDSGFEPGLQWLLDGIQAEAAGGVAERA